MPELMQPIVFESFRSKVFFYLGRRREWNANDVMRLFDNCARRAILAHEDGQKFLRQLRSRGEVRLFREFSGQPAGPAASAPRPGPVCKEPRPGGNRKVEAMMRAAHERTANDLQPEQSEPIRRPAFRPINEQEERRKIEAAEIACRAQQGDAPW